MRGAQRDQAVRIAEMTKEQQVGEQNAAFERERQVKSAEQEMRISVANAEALAVQGEKEAERGRRIAVSEANAQAIMGENLAQAKVVASNAELQLRQAEAFQLSETKKREAEAAVQEAQNRALARTALAEAERIEAEQRAQLEAPAKAMKAQVIVDAQAAAEKRRIEAEGEAAAIFAKLDAEARGQYEILAKKGDGLQRIVEACGGSKEAFQMLLLEHLDNLAETAAKAMSNIKFDKVIVWEGGNQNGQSATGNFIQSMARTLPPMLQVMRDIGGVELPESLVKLSEAPDKATAPAKETPPPASAAATPKA